MTVFRSLQVLGRSPALSAGLKSGLSSTGRRHYVQAYGYTQAKALVYSKYGPPTDVLKLHHYSIPPAYGDEIVVRFLASPVNPADLNQIEGVYPSKPEMTQTLGTTEPSAVGGNEGAVEIIAVGGKVKDFKVGDWAIMKKTKYGSWRTHGVIHADQLLKVPSDGSITPVQAATVSVNPCTAYRMLKDFVELKEGDWFIQNAANSGVGRAAIQIGKLWGLKSVNVVRNRPNIDELREELDGLGADLVITEDELANKSIKTRLERLTQGKGISLGLNCVGGKATTDLMRNLKAGGHMVTYGAMARQPVTVPASIFIFKDITLHGFWLSIWNDKFPEQKAAMVDEILKWTAEGKLKDIPFEKTVWKYDTPESEILAAIKKSGQDFAAKQVFEFDTK